MGTRFHADVHIPATVAADPAKADGTLGGPGQVLFSSGVSGIVVRELMVSTDTACRIAVGTADQDDRRIRAGYFGANGGAAPSVCWEGPPGTVLAIWRSAAGNVDVSIDGELI